jgi:hypothetical protein
VNTIAPFAMGAAVIKTKPASNNAFNINQSSFINNSRCPCRQKVHSQNHLTIHVCQIAHIFVKSTPQFSRNMVFLVPAILLVSSSIPTSILV